MKTILSFTTIPPRFQYVTDYIENLKKLENFDEIWVNIPKKYNRFPNWDGIFPYENFGPKVIINTDCEDLGPGTSAFAPIIKKSDADILIVVNDDTIYQTDLIIHLIHHQHLLLIHEKQKQILYLEMDLVQIVLQILFLSIYQHHFLE